MPKSSEDPEKDFSLWKEKLSDLARSIGEFDSAHDEMIVEFEVLFEEGLTRWTRKDVLESIEYLKTQFIACLDSINVETSDRNQKIRTIFDLMIHEEQLRTEALIQLTPFASVPFVKYSQEELLVEITKYYTNDELAPTASSELGQLLEQSILTNLPLIIEQVELGEPARREQKRRKIGKNAIKTTIILSGTAASAFLARYLLS